MPWPNTTLPNQRITWALVERFPAGTTFEAAKLVVAPADCFVYIDDRSAAAPVAGSELFQELIGCETVDDTERLVSKVGSPARIPWSATPLAEAFELAQILSSGGGAAPLRWKPWANDEIRAGDWLDECRGRRIEQICSEFFGRPYTDITGEDPIPPECLLIPAELMLFELLQLKGEILAMAYMLTPDQELVRRLESTAHSMFDALGSPENGCVEQVLGSPVEAFAMLAAQSVTATMSTYVPSLFTDGPPHRRRWTLDNWLIVELFNDYNSNFPVKYCENPDCRSPFTRQLGQSMQRQSRRDARACSKSCADRLAYLRRRERRDPN